MRTTFGIVVPLLLLTGCSWMIQQEKPQTIALLSPDNKAVQVTVEVADTPQEHREGLKGRKNLPEGRGMLFLFPQPATLTFWMKDTHIPLDILYFDGQGRFVSHETMQPCTENPCERYQSDDPAQIALEVNAGFVEKHGVEEGWRIALPASL